MERHKNLTDQQQIFLNALFDADVLGDVRLAAAKAGYSSPDKNAYRVARSLKEQITERTKEFIAVNGPKAAFTLSGTLEGPPTPGTKERLLAAKEILDRGGVLKAEELKLGSSTMLFILPPKNESEPDSEDEGV